ncbi:MAG: hypothetical protein R6U43_10365 [Candidatus Krumholzibacteriales bacterium]
MSYRYGLISVLLIISWLLISSAVTLSAAEDESARIMALGGSVVEGIIPDFYTDFRNNPAVLAGLDRTSILYRMVDRDIVDLPFFIFDYDWNLDNPYMYHSSPINAADIFWGRGPGSWKIALSTAWELSRSELNRPDIEYFNDEYSIYSRENIKDSWSLDLTVARRAGSNLLLGMRVGGYSFYQKNEERGFRCWEYHRFEDAEELLRKQYARNDGSGLIARRLSAYIEFGLRTEKENGEFSELSFRVSRASNTYYENGWYIRLDSRYDEFSGTTYLTDQQYNSSNLENFAEGNSWIFGFSGRHRNDSGYIVAASATYERCLHDGARLKSMEDIDYNYVAEDLKELRESIDLRGEGSSDRMSGALKIGKKLILRRDIDLYLGIAGFGSHTGWNYDPVTEYKLRLRKDHDYYSERSSDRTEFSMKLNSAAVYLPVSLEFKPASFFTYFASATPFLHVEVTTEKLGLPDSGIFNNIDQICSSEITTRNIWTDYRITTGFRLNYRDKIHVDIFTGSSLFIENLSYLDINIGYNF